MAIQETKIDSSISNSELFQETSPYSLYRKDRNLNGGGHSLSTRIFRKCPSQNWNQTCLGKIVCKQNVSFHSKSV